jgi:hypothetical protein
MEDIHLEIEAFIEETYLSSLSEKNLLKNLEQFSEICGRTISETIKDTHSLRFLNSRLRAIRDAQLSENSIQELNSSPDDKNELSSLESFRRRRIKKIVENKQIIIKIIEEVSPTTAEKIRKSINAHSIAERASGSPEPIPQNQITPPNASIGISPLPRYIERRTIDESIINRNFSLIFGFMSFCLAIVIFALLISL